VGRLTAIERERLAAETRYRRDREQVEARFAEPSPLSPPDAPLAEGAGIAAGGTVHQPNGSADSVGSPGGTSGPQSAVAAPEPEPEPEPEPRSEPEPEMRITRLGIQLGFQSGCTSSQLGTGSQPPRGSRAGGAREAEGVLAPGQQQQPAEAADREGWEGPACYPKPSPAAAAAAGGASADDDEEDDDEFDMLDETYTRPAKKPSPASQPPQQSAGAVVGQTLQAMLPSGAALPSVHAVQVRVS
jgi:hypothetical protein